ncbi:hypothetical protein IGI04_042690 [Brassica rapa subsp. trilocularis]|uniref:Uncharacterized protein n=1 Tax=Brassica rapa subsp. trilocularis TaxID=1813537 RepID=A0ABQ7KL84_BRACM|nr:hypothetical protein IGI04_042690 [Brassica rapa subsp. trilocularis]
MLATGFILPFYCNDKEELQDQEHITLTAALKSLIHPFALSFKYSQITGLPHGIGGDLLLLVCLEPGAQQPRGLRFLNRLLHTRTFPLLHTMVGLPLVCLEPGAQQPRGLRFLNQLLHTSIFPLLHTMVQVFLFSWIGGEQRTLLVNLKHHSNSSKDKTQEYWDQSLINHQEPGWFLKPPRELAMAFVESESLDSHPPPTPSVHGHLLVSPTQRLLLSSSLLGAIILTAFMMNRVKKALGGGALDEVRESSPYTSASNESLLQVGFELRVELVLCGSYSSACSLSIQDAQHIPSLHKPSTVLLIQTCCAHTLHNLIKTDPSDGWTGWDVRTLYGLEVRRTMAVPNALSLHHTSIFSLTPPKPPHDQSKSFLDLTSQDNSFRTLLKLD